jgi:hypothetical protein
MTSITFQRTGGIIGNELNLTLDLDDLPPDDAERLQKLIDKADFFNIPANLAGRSSPDEFQYVVEVDDGGRSHTVRTTDTSMPVSLLPLVKELTMQRILH